ncbi:ead/Ea22-like family protein [Escherichia coli]|nr:ead/Ea22-like family protein [Escherichia coli]MBY7614648.1 ead/Ea22-like family protein [Escherichia coli]MBY7626294.1 ead/Ea22-like family protein [Escherichia coli]
MSEINYQALREAAEKATCGEWSLEYGDGRFDGDDALIHREAAGYIPICRIEGAHPESGFDEDFQMEQQANAEFIAAANPATVLALLGELEAAENNLIDSECHVAELEEALRDKQALLEASEKRIAELEAELVSQTYKLNELSGNYPVTPDGWISCSERMPNDKQFVWCWGKSYGWTECDTFEGYYDCSRNKWWAVTDNGEEPASKVTHWMPLPEPPQEVK